MDKETHNVHLFLPTKLYDDVRKKHPNERFTAIVIKALTMYIAKKNPRRR